MKCPDCGKPLYQDAIHTCSPQTKPVAWAMPRKDGVYIDVITPEEHARMPGQYTVPLYAAPQPKAKPCHWQQEDDDTGAWASGCGELWSFIDGGPNENRVRFCHGCGNPVEVKA